MGHTISKPDGGAVPSAMIKAASGSSGWINHVPQELIVAVHLAKSYRLDILQPISFLTSLLMTSGDVSEIPAPIAHLPPVGPAEAMPSGAQAVAKATL